MENYVDNKIMKLLIITDLSTFQQKEKKEAKKRKNYYIHLSTISRTRLFSSLERNGFNL